jgi:hypothetical protein
MEFYPQYNLRIWPPIIVVAYCWSKETFQSYASSINKHYYYYYYHPGGPTRFALRFDLYVCPATPEAWRGIPPHIFTAPSLRRTVKSQQHTIDREKPTAHDWPDGHPSGCLGRYYAQLQWSIENWFFERVIIRCHRSNLFRSFCGTN